MRSQQAAVRTNKMCPARCAPDGRVACSAHRSNAIPSSISGPSARAKPIRRKISNCTIVHLVKRMQRADFVRRSRQRDVDPGERARFFLRTELCGARFDRGGDSVANFVEQFANDWLLFFARAFSFARPMRKCCRCVRDISLARFRALARQSRIRFRAAPRRGVVRVDETWQTLNR